MPKSRVRRVPRKAKKEPQSVRVVPKKKEQTVQEVLDEQMKPKKGMWF